MKPTDINVAGTRVGRLSSFSPNPSAVPRPIRTLDAAKYAIPTRSSGSVAVRDLRLYASAARLACDPAAIPRDEFIRSWWPALLHDRSVASGRTSRLRKKRVKLWLAETYDHIKTPTANQESAR